MNEQFLFEHLSEKSPGVLNFGTARMALLDIEAGFWGIRRQMEALIGSRLSNSVLQQAGANGGASFASSFGSAEEVDEQRRLFEDCVRAYQVAGFGQFTIDDVHWPVGRLVLQGKNTVEAWMVQRHGQKAAEPVCAYTAGVLVGFINVISKRQDVVCIEHKCQAMGDESCAFELIPASQAKNQTVIAYNPDPGLGRQLNLLETLFERMPMGIAILDREYHILRYNPTWIDFSERYAPPSAAPLMPGVRYFDHQPGTEPVVLPLFEETINGKTIHQNGVRLESEGIVTYWDVVLAPLVEDDEIDGILVVAVDATQREAARQNLEQRVSERTHELHMLLDMSSAASSSLELAEMLSSTLGLLVDLVNASRAGVILRDESTGKLTTQLLRPVQDIDPAEMEKMLRACESVVSKGEPLYIDSDPENGLMEPGALLPLRIRDQVIGVLVIIGPQGGSFSIQQQALFRSIAEQVSVAVENARLYEQAEQVAITAERNRLARDLHDAVSQTLFSASLIADVLPKLWDKNPEAGKQKLEELRLLTRGALSEMRTLLLELRPDAFRDVDLGDLYRHLGNAFTARTRIPVNISQDGEAGMPLNVKEVFYRVGQEALNNIGKHAGATKVDIRLSLKDGQTHMEIQDDGCGFDTLTLSAENLGLKIMAERVDSIKGKLKIESKIGTGTAIQLSWQAEEE